MLVVSYNDFSENMNKYLAEASSYGLKILPNKKEKKKSQKTLKLINAMESVVGIIPSDVDIENAKTEAILKA